MWKIYFTFKKSVTKLSLGDVVLPSLFQYCHVPQRKKSYSGNQNPICLHVVKSNFSVLAFFHVVKKNKSAITLVPVDQIAA